MHFSHLLATLVLLATATSSATAQAANCFKYGKPCPKDFPFCSARPGMNTCSSALWDGYLDNGCTVNASQPNACVEKPMCKDFRIDFNDPNEVPIRTKYEGNPEKQPFIIDTANNVAVKDGSLWLNMRWVGPGGALARVISTRNFHYGTFSARIRISPGSGFVYTWIFKTSADSDKIGDEIDWEWVPGSSPGFQEAQSNWFQNGNIDYTNGGKHRTPKTLDQWHTYTMRYMPNKVEWLIDDVVVRTLESNATFKTPSATGRLFLSIWDTCEMPEGTRNWAGGAPAWCNKTAGSEETKKEFRMPVDWVEVKCAEGYSDTKPVLVPKVEGGQVNAGFIPISGAAQLDAKSIGAMVAYASLVFAAALAAML